MQVTDVLFADGLIRMRREEWPISAFPVDYYDRIVKWRVDPVGVLAIFWHESNFGAKGVAVQTHSWGNMRNPPVGDIPYTLYATPNGQYLAFDNWLDGCEATAAHIAQAGYFGLTVEEFFQKWAPKGDGGNDPEAYAASVVDWMNARPYNAPVEVAKVPRIVVSAGHENIEQITADRIGQASADTLRHATGANGEREWTVAWADALAKALQASGYDAIRTDSIYHSDVYSQDADLVIVGHYDGVSGTDRTQYCMAATVHSGASTVETDARADTFVDAWYKSYPAQTGIPGTGTITVDMTQYYQGWYRTAHTPMVIVEHCLGADGNGVRPDRPTPEAAATADANAIRAWLPTGQQTAQQFVPHDSPNGFAIHPLLWPRWNYMDSLDLALPMIGYPTTDNVITLKDGRTAQRFERGWMAGSNPANVVMLFPEESPQ